MTQQSRRRAPGSHTRAGAAAFLASVAIAVAVAALSPLGAAEKKVTHVTGSRATYIHRLALKDSEGGAIKLDGDPVMPFSYRTTCTKCHEYDQVRKGWHFNATDPAVLPGRPGQPWFWTDPRTGTQLPLSYRDWPNTWRPGDVGMTPWKFTLTFGHHLPGGGSGEMSDVEDVAARWLVSGKLGINCGSCHSGEAGYDPIEYFLQVAGQNFMWAPAAASDIASVTGVATSMPPSYDPFMGPEDEKAAKTAPTVFYNKALFDQKGAAFFDIPSQPPDRRCYFCHSHVNVGADEPEPWTTDGDVHVLSGLTCSDCHRNGLDHQTTRNYEGEPASESHPELASLTCRGCHLGGQSAAAGPNTMGGRLGAPMPTHVGLPTIHLEHLACTTCHSGPLPEPKTRAVQTSRAHLIEFQGPHRGPDALPYIVEPVFARRSYDGKIGPQRMVWPAFWARLESSPEATSPEKVVPLSPEVVYEMAKDAFKMAIADEPAEAEPSEAETPEAEKAEAPADGPETPDTEEATDDEKTAEEAPEATEPESKEPEKRRKRLSVARIAAVLKMLAEKDEAKGVFAYVCAGKLYRLGTDGTLDASDHAATEPVAWPIAHNVRPAAQSLGGGGCTDCHGFDAPMAFGEVDVPSPADVGPAVTKAMYEFQGRDPLQLKAWAMSYMFRPMFKVVGFATAGVIAAVLVLYLFLGLAALLRWAGKKAPTGPV